MGWTEPKLFNEDNLKNVKEGKGVYEIGTYKKRKDGNEKQFFGYYVGRSKTSVKERLSTHLGGKGNTGIDGFMKDKERNNLYFRYQNCQFPATMESNLLNRKWGVNKWYQFNYRNEYLTSQEVKQEELLLKQEKQEEEEEGVVEEQLPSDEEDAGDDTEDDN